ncbi:MAG: hypothetical protein ACOCWZ_00770 [Spirochaetota bacterium]
MRVMEYNLHVTPHINRQNNQENAADLSSQVRKIDSFNYENVLMDLDELKSFLYLIVGARGLTTIDSAGQSGNNINARA